MTIDPLDPGAGEARGGGLRGAVPPVVTVSMLVASVRRALEREIGLVWVAGEISGFTRAASGHCYFNLKDAGAQVRCVFFRHKAQHAGFALKDGLAVELRATASVYEARGEFQLNVETIRLAGVGALYEQFARLKARLDAAGWFAPERKRALPAHPRAVGIVTSASGAAVHDIVTALGRRWPALPVIVYPCAVQGAGAAAEIAAAIATANLRDEVDVLIVGRGGGSIEDLWAFNEEATARAVLDSALPVVSAVGHETDFTICDFVADARAATPTAAAALVAPDREAVGNRLHALAGRLRRCATSAVEDPMQRADHLARRLVHPAARLERQREATRALAARLARAFGHHLAVLDARLARALLRVGQEIKVEPPGTRRLAQARERWARSGAARLDTALQRATAAGQALAHLNPQSVLDRGYAIVTRTDGAIVRDAATLAPADEIGLRLARGRARARVTGTETADGEPR